MSPHLSTREQDSQVIFTRKTEPVAGSSLQIQRMCNGLPLPGADQVSDYKGIRQQSFFQPV